MTHRHPRSLGAVLGVILWLGVGSSAGAATAGKPVRIGSTLGLTGPVAAAAIVHKITGDICVERLNRGNGLLGRPVEWANRVDTITGRVRFDGPYNYGDDFSKVKQVQDGRWFVVWPKEFAGPGRKLLAP